MAVITSFNAEKCSRLVGEPAASADAYASASGL